MPSNQADFLYLNIMENYSLVTGASSGIGLEICKYLASKKHNLILTARNEKKLKDISAELIDSFKIKCNYISCDLSKIESPKEIYDYCKSKKYNINEIKYNNILIEKIFGIDRNCSIWLQQHSKEIIKKEFPPLIEGFDPEL
mgnify:CR=1 FL=1